MSQTQSVSEYLSTLKEGDVVYRECKGSNIGFDLDRQVIARLTKSQIILKSGGRYNRATGASIGSTTWARNTLVVPTTAVKQRWKEIFLTRWAKTMFPTLFNDLTLEQQMALFRQAKAFAAANASASQPSASDEDL